MTNILRAKDIHERLGIGINQARMLIKRKDFPSIKIGKRYIVPEEEFEEWIHKNVYKKIDLK